MKRAVFLAGPLLGVLVWFVLGPSGMTGAGLSSNGAIVAGLLAWMAAWWATQAVDLAITGLLPVIVLSLFNIGTTQDILSPYANDIIFLFAGGCTIGFAIERHGLGQRFIAFVLSHIGHSPGRIIAGFLIATSLLSAWVSNTASAAIMLPLAMAAVACFAGGAGEKPEHHRAFLNFERAVLLAVAYGASIGGVMTLLGSPPNPIAAEWLRANGSGMDFLQWSMIGVPTAAVMMIATQIVFRVMCPMKGLSATAISLPVPRGPMSRAARITVVIFACAIVAWVGAPFLKMWIPQLKLRDGMIAIAAAVLLFIIPEKKGSGEAIVPWALTGRLPWGVFILFGGGLSLADAMQSTGVSDAVARSLSGLAVVPAPILLFLVVTMLIFASEIASNTALVATAVPIVGAMAPGLGIPTEKLVVAATLGASFAFMLPVGTPPSALIFSTGRVPMREMLRVGFVLDLCAAAIITVMCSILA
ncbi:MAG: DASS family sodium-coupled anion symporter [Planctomycetes bacterium]|nr:DASS family sodium-coupled anion symporter [Planctomycetota bacterium]